MRRALALTVYVVLLAGCSGGPGSMAPHAARIEDGATALPGGDGATALPGAALACPLVQQPGEASCTVAVNVSFPPLANPGPGTLIPGYHPADLRGRYALPSTGSGTVAIVDAFDDPTAESDLATYRATFGLPACGSANGCFKRVDQRGGTSFPVPNSSWAEEISLDLDMVSAICPGCSILLVEADSASISDLGTAVDTAAASGARAVSNSYYAGEWSSETAEDVHYRHSVPVVVSAGDSPATSYPAASPYVVSVGGTTLAQNGATWNEMPWAYGGRGCSSYEPMPQWQRGFTACGKMRSVVDVAAVADPQTGVAMFDSQAGGWLVAGGTSTGAPIVASAYALAPAVHPIAYAYGDPSGFFRLASGAYDPATGLGSLDGVGAL